MLHDHFSTKIWHNLFGVQVKKIPCVILLIWVIFGGFLAVLIWGSRDIHRVYLLCYKRNKHFRTRCYDINAIRSQHAIVDYFPITTCSVVVYFLLFLYWISLLSLQYRNKASAERDVLYRFIVIIYEWNFNFIVLAFYMLFFFSFTMHFHLERFALNMSLPGIISCFITVTLFYPLQLTGQETVLQTNHTFPNRIA